MSTLGCPDQFVQFDLDRLSVLVLGVLDQEDHQEGHDGRGGIDDELPGVAVVEQRSSGDPDQDDAAGNREGDGPTSTPCCGLREPVVPADGSHSGEFALPVPAGDWLNSDLPLI